MQARDEDVAKMEGAGWNRESGPRLDKHVTKSIRSRTLDIGRAWGLTQHDLIHLHLSSSLGFDSIFSLYSKSQTHSAPQLCNSMVFNTWKPSKVSVDEVNP